MVCKYKTDADGVKEDIMNQVRHESWGGEVHWDNYRFSDFDMVHGYQVQQNSKKTVQLTGNHCG